MKARKNATEKARLVKRLITKKIQAHCSPRRLPSVMVHKRQQDQVHDRVVLGGGVGGPVREQHLGVVDVAGAVAVEVHVAHVEVPAEEQRAHADGVVDPLEQRDRTGLTSREEAAVDGERSHRARDAENPVEHQRSRHCRPPFRAPGARHTLRGPPRHRRGSSEKLEEPLGRAGDDGPVADDEDGPFQQDGVASDGLEEGVAGRIGRAPARRRQAHPCASSVGGRRWPAAA